MRVASLVGLVAIGAVVMVVMVVHADRQRLMPLRALGLFAKSEVLYRQYYPLAR